MISKALLVKVVERYLRERHPRYVERYARSKTSEGQRGLFGGGFEGGVLKDRTRSLFDADGGAAPKPKPKPQAAAPQQTSSEEFERMHPRDDHGRFVAKEDLEAAKQDANKAEQLRARVTAPEERAKLDASIGKMAQPNAIAAAVEMSAPEPKPEPAKPQTDLFGQSVKPPPPKPAEFGSTAGRQQALFGTKGLPGQKSLFAEKGVPEDMVQKRADGSLVTGEGGSPQSPRVAAALDEAKAKLLSGKGDAESAKTPAAEQTLAEKIVAQRAAGKKAVRPPAKPKPPTMVSMAGAKYQLVKENGDGTVTLRNDQGDEFTTEPGEDYQIEQNKRAWKKNEDGTYTAPNGMVWKKAAAGGEESPVNGKPYDGGALMPIHGLSQAKKPTPPANTPASSVKANEDSERKVKEAAPRQPMSPEMIEEERKRREKESQWQQIRNGPLGSALGLGERQHDIRYGHGKADKWMEVAHKLGPEQTKALAEKAKLLAMDAVRKDLQKRAEQFGGEGNQMIDPKWHGGSGEPYTIDQAVQDYVDHYEAMTGQTTPQSWGITKKHLSSNPHTHDARMWVSEALTHGNQHDTLQALHATLSQPPQDKPKEPWTPDSDAHQLAVPATVNSEIAKRYSGIKKSQMAWKGNLHQVAGKVAELEAKAKELLASRKPNDSELQKTLNELHENKAFENFIRSRLKLAPAHQPRTEQWEIPQASLTAGLTPGTPGYEAETHWHKVAVRNALAAGKPVPPEVLADYPDLSPKPAPSRVDSALQAAKEKLLGTTGSKGTVGEAESLGTGKELGEQPAGTQVDKPPHEMTLEEFTNAKGFTGGQRYFQAGQEHRLALREAYEQGKTIPDEVLDDHPELRKAVADRKQRREVAKQAATEFRASPEGQIKAWEKWHGTEEMSKLHKELESSHPEYAHWAKQAESAALSSTYEGDDIDPAVRPYLARMNLIADREAQQRGIARPDNISHAMMQARKEQAGLAPYNPENAQPSEARARAMQRSLEVNAPAAPTEEADTGWTESTRGGSWESRDGKHVIEKFGEKYHALTKISGNAVVQKQGEYDSLKEAQAALTGLATPAAEPKQSQEGIAAVPQAFDPEQHGGYKPLLELGKHIRQGGVSAAEYKQHYEFWKKHGDEFRADLKKRYNATQIRNLANNLGYYHGTNKEEHAKSVQESLMRRAFHHGSMFHFGMEGPQKALDRYVASQTDESIAGWKRADEEDAAKEEQANQRQMERINNPQSIADYNAAIEHHGGYDKLPPEQQVAYDDLYARERRSQQKQKTATVQGFAHSQDLGDVGIVEGHHQKHNKPTYTVTVQNRVDGDKYSEMNTKAKQLGGNYVNAMIAKRYGATPGFQFFSKDAAQKFAETLGGKSVDRGDLLDERAAGKIENASERLTALADLAEQSANQTLNATRKENTTRRADMAASIRGRANADIAKAKTMRRIAEGLASGELTHLTGIRAKTHVDALDSMLRRAQYDHYLANKTGRFSQWEEHEQKPITPEVIASVKYPYPAIWDHDLNEHLEVLSEVPGMKRLAKELSRATDKSPYKKALGGVKISGGQALTASQLSHFANVRGLAEGKAVRVHVSTDPKLLKGKHEVAYTADGGKTWGTTTDIAVHAALSKTGAVDLMDEPRHERIEIKNSEVIGSLAKVASKLRNSSNPRLRSVAASFADSLERYNRLQAMSIGTPQELRAALREYLPLKQQQEKDDPVKTLERKIMGSKIPGFFPTPRPSIDKMLALADIQPGHEVLEPSAGKGDILDAIREQHPDAQTAAIEPIASLRDIITAKGHGLADDRDFLEHDGKQYDRIVMNPPFENRQDVKHVMHAHKLLKPGGKLVAIMSAGPFGGGSAQDQQFRDWLEQHGADVEDMEEGSFAGDEAFRKTNVRTKMVTITKAADPVTRQSYSRRMAQALRYARRHLCRA